MKKKCAICGVSCGFRQKFICYPGRAKGDLEITEGQPICNKCIEKRIDNVDPEQIAAIILLMQNEKAHEAFESLMNNYNPQSPASNYNFGNVLANLHEFDKALEYYDTALFLDTHYVKAWYRKGGVLYFTDKLPAAVKCFENVIELDSKNAIGWSLPAKFYRMLCLIQMHNSTITLGNDSSLSQAINTSIIELHPIALQIKNFEKEVNNLIWLIRNNQIQKFINDFVDFCFEHRNEILDLIEPDEVFSARSPEKKWF